MEREGYPPASSYVAILVSHRRKAEMFDPNSPNYPRAFFRQCGLAILVVLLCVRVCNAGSGPSDFSGTSWGAYDSKAKPLRYRGRFVAASPLAPWQQGPSVYSPGHAPGASRGGTAGRLTGQLPRQGAGRLAGFQSAPGNIGAVRQQFPTTAPRGVAVTDPYRTAINSASRKSGAAIPVDEPWQFQLFPDGLIYRSYLAGAKEPRFRSVWSKDQSDGWVWDITLGGRVPIARFGTVGEYFPQGWQIDIEGAGLPRLDLENNEDLVSADFRFGVPITYGVGRFQTKMAYYHLSSHVGDEFLVRNPGFQRVNFSRDVLVWGLSYYINPDLRVYAEAGWAFYSDVSEPWEFQFGMDYSPNVPTGLRGLPFAAINGHLREEVNFGGNVVVQGGWQWRDHPGGPLIRFGLEYYNGMSEQYAFFNLHEEKIGFGLWYDY